MVHRLRGQPSARRKPPALRTQVLALCAEERYEGFGPTLMAEHLLKAKLVVDQETLRRWRMATGQHTVHRRKQKHRQWRERQPCFGAMVQLDGSHHDWFEGRGPKCVLMVMVDDATNQMSCRFFAEETTRASYDVLEGWIKKHGLPGSLYVDRDSIYRCEGVGRIAEQLAGKAPQTQFGRAMEALGIKLILAHSPQAKGRVERMNGTLQDRLVKELRLAGISDLESANRFLDGKYLRACNRKFARAAAQPLDAPRKNPKRLEEVLSWETERVVQGDWTVTCEGKRYQLDPRHEALRFVRRKVMVRTLRKGRVELVYRGQALKWRALPEGSVRKPMPVKQARAARKAQPEKVGTPPPQEPSVAAGWRGHGAEVLERDQGAGTRGAADGAGLRSAVATLRPPCIPYRQPEKPSNKKQTNKGTFSRELIHRKSSGSAGGLSKFDSSGNLGWGAE